jgi:hypothetical protein
MFLSILAWSVSRRRLLRPGRLRRSKLQERFSSHRPPFLAIFNFVTQRPVGIGHHANQTVKGVVMLYCGPTHQAKATRDQRDFRCPYRYPVERRDIQAVLAGMNRTRAPTDLQAPGRSHDQPLRRFPGSHPRVVLMTRIEPRHCRRNRQLEPSAKAPLPADACVS